MNYVIYCALSITALTKLNCFIASYCIRLKSLVYPFNYMIFTTTRIFIAQIVWLYCLQQSVNGIRVSFVCGIMPRCCSNELSCKYHIRSFSIKSFFFFCMFWRWWAIEECICFFVGHFKLLEAFDVVTATLSFDNWKSFTFFVVTSLFLLCYVVHELHTCIHVCPDELSVHIKTPLNPLITVGFFWGTPPALNLSLSAFF